MKMMAINCWNMPCGDIWKFAEVVIVPDLWKLRVLYITNGAGK